MSLHRAPRRRSPLAVTVVLALIAATLSAITFTVAHPSKAGADELPPQNAPSQITLTASNTSFVAGDSVRLTATTDFDVATSNSTIAIVDQTTNQTLRTCTSGTTCDTSARFFTGPAHTYVATVDALTSDPVTVTRASWSITLTADKTTYKAGDSVTLTATANQNLDATNNAYAIFIWDEVTHTAIGECYVGNEGATWVVNSSGQTVCNYSTRFYTGGPHTYIAFVAATNGSADPAGASDTQATSGEVTATRSAWSIALTEDKPIFHPGESVTLTATANQNLDATNNAYAIFIWDETAHTAIGECYVGNEGATWVVNSSGQTVCNYSTRFYTGGPHAYIAFVGPSNGSADPAQASDVQATGNEVTATRADWNITLSSDKTVYSAGESVTLTATANQNLDATNNAYAIFIWDETAHTAIGECYVGNEGATWVVNSSGQTVCNYSTRFYTGGPHTYIAFVGPTNGSADPNLASDTQARSNEVTAARKAWTVGLAIDKPVFAAGESVNLVAVGNQNLEATNKRVLDRHLG